MSLGAPQVKSESCSVVANSLQPHGLYTVRGILQPRILEWVAFPFSRGSSQPRDITGVSCIAGRFLIHFAIREALVCGRKLKKKKVIFKYFEDRMRNTGSGNFHVLSFRK